MSLPIFRRHKHVLGIHLEKIHCFAHDDKPDIWAEAYCKDCGEQLAIERWCQFVEGKRT